MPKECANGTIFIVTSMRSIITFVTQLKMPKECTNGTNTPDRKLSNPT
jgi:hypothetical protein